MRALVTGGAGFLGSHLVDALMDAGWQVSVVDNLSSGSLENLRRWLDHPRLSFYEEDLKSRNGSWLKALEDVDVVFHFAANPEVRTSATEPRVHFDENVLATFNVLEAAREAGIGALVFASTSAVYGEGGEKPVGEEEPKKPISVYGASKLACEVLIETYHRLYGMKALVLRFANVVGPRAKHGVIVDFIAKLRENPRKLIILGDGSQRRSFIYVKDAISATLFLLKKLMNNEFSCEVFNIGNDDWISVLEVADIVVEEMGLKDVRYEFLKGTPDGRGWPGDVKKIRLDISKLKGAGWRPTLSSREAVRETVRSLISGEGP